MTKKEFTEAVIAKAGVEITKADAQKMVDAVIAVVSDELSAGNKIALNGLGSFDVVDKPERTVRNPRTNDMVTVAASKAVKFKAAKALKDSVNA